MEVFNQANLAALDAFDELGEQGVLSSVEEPVNDAVPFLAGFVSEQDRQAMVDEFDHVGRTGGKASYDLLDAAELRTMEPALDAGVTHGISINDQRFINPGRFVNSLADAVRCHGGTVLDGLRVVDVTERSGSVLVTYDDGQSLAADAVVIASGSWLGKLARRHGVRKIVQAGRGYSFTVHPSACRRDRSTSPRSASPALRSAARMTVFASPG